MKKEELATAIEAVLFANGDPVSIQRLCQTFDAEPEEINEAVEILKSRYADNALEVLNLENTFQISTKKCYAEYIKKAFDIKRKTPLSQAGLEVLSVIAYNQPVTRAFIEQVRGVDCSGVMNTLIEKELIEERGRLELPGRPLLYGTTKNFLRCFSMSDLSELPEIPRDENTAVPDIAEQLEVNVGEIQEQEF